MIAPLQTESSSVLSVTQITQAIKNQLETKFSFVSVQGEISNFKKQSSGHLYFSLKDAGAQISAVMFRGSTKLLKQIPKDGDHVIVKGEIGVYPPHGKYQLIAKELTLMGLGALLQKLEDLKIKIHKRGWFSKKHKKPLPKFPKRIGVVTSPTGAVIQDILNVLKRRFSGFHLILNPVKVQGDGAAQEIARAIEDFNKYDLADLLIVGRGGGSIEDLWAFNEEIVASAIFHSKIPIIAAIGHETDHTIADYVADIRAPTPSAAAELATTEKAASIDYLVQIQQRIGQAVHHLIRQSRHRMEGLLRHPLFRSPYALLGPYLQNLDDLRHHTDLSMRQLLQRYRLRLDAKNKQAQALKPSAQIKFYLHKLTTLEKQISIQSLRLISVRKERLKNIKQNLKSINPRQLLKKGYSILFSEKDGSAIVSSHQLKPEDPVNILFSDGKAKATIKEVIKNRE